MTPVQIALISVFGGIALLCLCGFFLRRFLTAPAKPREGIERFKGLALAHRGLHKNPEVPENSLPAFKAAVEAGYGVELDVQLSSDGIPVVFHDQTLDRVCGIPGSTRDYPLEKLATTPLFGQEGIGVPTFAEVLEVIGGRVPILVEIKGEDPAFDLTCAKAAELLDRYDGEYWVESFNPLALAWFRKHRPNVLRGQLAMAYLRQDKYKGKFKYFVLQHFLLNFRARPDFIAYRIGDRDDRSFLRLRRVYGVPTVSWTVKTKDDLAASPEAFDGLIFEGEGRPDGEKA